MFVLDGEGAGPPAVCVQGAERVAAFDPMHPEQITENCH
jgi:hypothetical protein